MLIKGVTKKGDAIPMSPVDAAEAAIKYAVRNKNTSEKIYWLDKRSVKIKSIRSIDKKQDGWEAWLEAEASVGYTCVKRDRFFQPKKHTIKIHYKTDKDDIGMPDIIVVSCSMGQVETNPAALVGKIPETPERRLAVGELVRTTPPAPKPDTKRRKSKN